MTSDGPVPDSRDDTSERPVGDRDPPGAEPILRAENLAKYYDTSEGLLDSLLGRGEQVQALEGISLDLYEGETLAVVGESGCGKSTLGRALCRLLEPTAGSVVYRGEDVTELSASALRDLRTNLQYVFQDPFSSLDPRLTAGDIVGEPLDVHDLADGAERRERVAELFEAVGLDPGHVHRYPHEFSGGQRQRIGIARALAVEPEVIVCDEPVSALDVSVQAQILNLLSDLQEEFGLSYVVVAHDLSVVEHLADRVAVMYLGEFVEVGPTEAVFEPPHHPYTEALLSAIPEPDPLWEGEPIDLSGSVPSPIDPPSGCRFHTRCPHVIQPADAELDQAVWRSLVDLECRLRGAEDLATVTPASRHGAEPSDPSSATRDALDDLVREAFDLPRPIDGERAFEGAFQRAVDRLSDGDLDGAHDALVAAVETPCASDAPDLHETGAEHTVACHLYDDRFADARATSAPEGTEQTSEDG